MDENFEKIRDLHVMVSDLKNTIAEAEREAEVEYFAVGANDGRLKAFLEKEGGIEVHYNYDSGGGQGWEAVYVCPKGTGLKWKLILDLDVMNEERFGR